MGVIIYWKDGETGVFLLNVSFIWGRVDRYSIRGERKDFYLFLIIIVIILIVINDSIKN